MNSVQAHKRIISAVKGVGPVSGRMSYIILRGCWCDTDVKDSFYGKEECVFNKILKYHTKVLLGHFNAILGKEDIFKATIGKENLHKICDDSEVRLYK
jgi:hypothetical protein